MIEFIRYQIRLFTTGDAGHGQPFYYHFIVLLIGCFPASLFLFQYSKKRTNEAESSKDFTRWMWLLFWVTLLLFSIVKTKIVHYSSLCYFPLTYLAALKTAAIAEAEETLKTRVKVGLVIIGSILALLIAFLPLVGIYKTSLIPFIQDPFAVANLSAQVSWGWEESLWGFAYLIIIVVSLIWMRKNFIHAMRLLLISTIIILQVTVLHFTPKIEAYSQRAAIRYFKGFVGKDVYIHVLGYKSYAHYFYAETQPQNNPKRRDESWLLKGDVDKPTYFICKITAAEPYKHSKELKLLGEKNGFVFFKRIP